MTYANIQLRTDVDNQGHTFVIHPFLQPLAEAVALAHPTWILEGKDYKFSNFSSTNPSTLSARSLVITDKREEIGRVLIGTYNNNNCFVIHNERIQKTKQRGAGVKTTNMKLAIKLINKFVSRKTIPEMVLEAFKQTAFTASNVMHSKRQERTAVYESMINVLTDFLVAQWDTISPQLALSTRQASYPKVADEARIAQEVHTALTSGAGYIVFVNGLDYAVRNVRKGDLEKLDILTSEQLPDFIRRGVGMLKLVEDSQIIERVGLKVKADTFFILDAV